MAIAGYSLFLAFEKVTVNDLIRIFKTLGETHPAGALQGGGDAGAPGPAHPGLRGARRRRPLHEGLPLVTPVATSLLS